MTTHEDQKKQSKPVEQQNEKISQKKPFVNPILERQDKLSVVVGSPTEF